MTKLMDPDEKEVATTIADYLAAGDDRIASKLGTLTVHMTHAFSSAGLCIVRIDGKLDDAYEIEIVARRRRR